MGTASFRIRLIAAEVAASLGESDRVAALLDEIEPRLAGTTFHHFDAEAQLLRAHLALARGEIYEAESRAHRALELALEHEMMLVTADALEALALPVSELGDPARAGRLLGAVEAFRHRTGYRWRYPHQRSAIESLRPSLDGAHLAEGGKLTLAEAAELARRGRGERGRPSHGWDSLTPSEARVVELVAAGLPNREIAAKLFVSLATVKTHLVHVYTKLGVRTRTELAAASIRAAGRARNGGERR
jgi:ATP/maltotriose-dependent transcriptional regulator MalT